MAYRFSPAPGWPAPTAGWTPPEAGHPDPAWTPAPDGAPPPRARARRKRGAIRYGVVTSRGGEQHGLSFWSSTGLARTTRGLDAPGRVATGSRLAPRPRRVAVLGVGRRHPARAHDSS